MYLSEKGIGTLLDDTGPGNPAGRGKQDTARRRHSLFSSWTRLIRGSFAYSTDWRPVCGRTDADVDNVRSERLESCPSVHEVPI